VTATFIHGDHVSCSRVGGAMRRESSRLRQHAQLLDDVLGELVACEVPDANAALTAVTAIAASLVALRATADDLDRAGAAVQRYATDLAEAHELGRRAELRVVAAGLLLEGTRVIEPWGPSSAHEAQRRRAQVPEVQARVDKATAHVGRARGRLGREVTRLTEGFSRHSRDARSARPAPLPRADPALAR
jgi:hypothetical protein